VWLTPALSGLVAVVPPFPATFAVEVAAIARSPRTPRRAGVAVVVPIVGPRPTVPVADLAAVVNSPVQVVLVRLVRAMLAVTATRGPHRVPVVVVVLAALARMGHRRQPVTVVQGRSGLAAAASTTQAAVAGRRMTMAILEPEAPGAVVTAVTTQQVRTVPPIRVAVAVALVEA
jgi:hypothetical protein